MPTIPSLPGERDSFAVNSDPPRPADIPSPAPVAPIAAAPVAPAPTAPPDAANDDSVEALKAFLASPPAAPAPAPTAPTARASMYAAMDGQPDMEAQLRDVSRRTGVPVDSIRAFPDVVKKKAAMQAIDFDELATKYPNTTAFLGNVDNARIAHDDVPGLKTFETLMNSLRRGVPGLMQIGSGTALRSNANTLAQIDNAESLLAQGRKGLSLGEDPQGIEFMSPAKRQALRSNLGQALIGNAASITAAQATKADYPSPPVVDQVMKAKTFADAFTAFRSDPVNFIAAIGPESLVTSAPSLLGALVIPGGPAVKAATMGVGSAVTDYGSSIIEALGKEGVNLTDPNALLAATKDQALMQRVAAQAIAHAGVVGVFDAASGRMASSLTLPSKLAAKMAAFPVTREVAGAVAQMPIQGAMGAAGEAGGELAAGQPLDPGNILAEFAGEAFSTPGEIAAIAHGQVAERLQQAREAQQRASLIKQLTELSTASKVLQRDTTTFETFAQSLTEAGAKDLWISPDALAQSGVADKVMAISPEIAEQVRQSIDSHADIRIPLAEFTGRLSKEGLAQSLVDHVKTEPEGFSKVEADAYMQEHGQTLNAEVEKVLTQRQGDDAFAASRAAVQTDLTTKLNAAARFTPDVNVAYSTLMANFFATQASRLGVTPEALYQQYTPSIVAESPVGGGQVLDQRGGLGAVPGHTLAVEGHDQSVSLQAKMNRAGIGSKLLTNLFEGEPLSPEGDRLLSAPSLSAMLAHVRRAVLNDPQILDAIVGAVPVDVVNNLFGSESAAKVALHNEPMFKEGAALNADLPISEAIDASSPVGLLLREAALQAAKVPGVPLRLALEPAKNTGAPNAGQGDSLSQNDSSTKTARATYDPSTHTITLLRDADLTSFLHESGHFYLEVLADLASKPNAPQAIVDDMNALLAWFGVPGAVAAKAGAPVLNQEPPKTATDQSDAPHAYDFGVTADQQVAPEAPMAGRSALETWHLMTLDEKRQFHEQFARGFEAYLFEGTSPSPEVHDVFQRFRSWLLNVYKSITKLNVQLTDEVRGVMDRLIATEEQIHASEAARGMGLLFKDEAEAKQFGVDWAAYQAQGKSATDTAVDELQAKGVRDMQWLSNARSKRLKQMQQQADSLRAEIERGVRSEVMSQPVYQAWQFLTGKDETGENAGKLRTAALKEAYGDKPDAAWRKLSALHMTSPTVGLNPELVAETFGFTSADEMVKAIAAATPPKEVVSAITDQRMLEQHGDLATPEGVQRATDEAIHNQVRSRMVATELAALEKAANPREATGKLIRTKLKDGTTRTRMQTVATLPRAARQFAADLIARTKVRDILPGQYSAAEGRAARAAEQALKSGDIQEAATQKRAQLINGYANTAAHDAKAEIDAGIDYLGKFDKPRKSIDPDYQDQIDSILERFDLRRGQSLKSIDKRKSLASWIESQEDIGIAVELPEKVRVEAFRQSYKDMTVEEFRGVVESVRQIEHLGRLKSKLLTAKSDREFNDVRDELVASINGNGAGRTADTRTPTTGPGRWLQAVKNFGSAHIKAATWARIMDGGKDGGAVWEAFVRAANEKGDQETNMRAQATLALSEIMAPVLKSKMTKKTFFPSVGKSFTRESVFTMALNTGNQGNLQRLLGGEGWTLDQLKPMLDTLSAEDWQTVQKVWDHFETYRPLIAAKERRVSGVEPNWIEPTPVVTAHGTFKGGYYPIQYDPSASVHAEQHADAEEARQQLKGAYTSATTRRSFTKSRVDEVSGRPLLYTLQGLYGGVNDVIHDLSWHEWLIDTNRLLRSEAIDTAMREHYGPAAVRQFKTWSEAIATGDTAGRHALDSMLGVLRQNVSMAGLGYNVMTSAMQFIGATQSIVRIGPTWFAKGLMSYVGAPIAQTKEANAKSEFMANRARTRFRDLNELKNRVQGQSTAREKLIMNSYWLLMKFQQTVDVPTWHGAYEKAISEGNDEDRSIALADQAVIDSQGGGHLKDQAAIERGGAAQKIFTSFYSFQNTALNILVQRGMTNKHAAQTAVDFLMLTVIPTTIMSLMKDALTPGDSGDDDDKKLLKKLAAANIENLFGLFVLGREFGQAMSMAAGVNDSNRGYSGPAGLRAISDRYQLSQQMRQGEFDDAFRKAAINMAGDALGLPAAQINRSITGIEALHAGKTQNPAAVLFGYQEKK